MNNLSTDSIRQLAGAIGSKGSIKEAFEYSADKIDNLQAELEKYQTLFAKIEERAQAGYILTFRGDDTQGWTATSTHYGHCNGFGKTYDTVRDAMASMVHLECGGPEIHLEEEGATAAQSDEQLYYLLAADYSKRQDNLVWWGPDDSGYTQDLKGAGVYTFEQIHPTCWKDDEYDTIPVKKELVDALYSPQHVRHETKNLESLGIDMKRWWGKTSRQR